MAAGADGSEAVTASNILAEMLFYHLEKQPLEAVLPSLLERTLSRGWRAVVQVRAEERLAFLDAHLWTYRDDSFLPHGTKADGHLDLQPIVLTTGEENPNGAGVRFLVDGATLAGFSGYARIVSLFDGNDAAAVQAARAQWQAAKAAGCAVTYWKQGAGGGWERKA
jgi:DNA polymerase III subunit chi